MWGHVVVCVMSVESDFTFDFRSSNFNVIALLPVEHYSMLTLVVCVCVCVCVCV